MNFEEVLRLVTRGVSDGCWNLFLAGPEATGSQKCSDLGGCAVFSKWESESRL